MIKAGFEGARFRGFEGLRQRKDMFLGIYGQGVGHKKMIKYFKLRIFTKSARPGKQKNWN